MHTAIYYPYVAIEEPSLLKQALFLWDSLEVITPQGFPKQIRTADNQLSEAAELLVSNYSPTEEEKRITHDIILQLTAQELPEWFYFKADGLKDFIYSEKFLPETWHHLQDRGLACQHPEGRIFYATPALALVMMAILADTCAGKLKRTVTGEWVAYGALSRYLTLLNRGSYGAQIDSDGDVVAAIPFRSINLEKVPLANLLRLRKKELGHDGHLYRDLRHNLLKAVDDHVTQLATKEYSEADRRELQRVFDQRITDDYEGLREELGDAAKDCLLSKEMLAVVVGAAGSLVQPVAGGVVAIGGILSVGRKYRTARRESLRGHITSYVYMAQQGRIEWR
jgi:hypothetical protein